MQNDFKKVKNIYYKEKTLGDYRANPSWTGLILELEDGTLLQQQSDSCLMPYEPLKDYLKDKPKADEQ